MSATITGVDVDAIVHQAERIEGWMSEDELRWLAAIAQHMGSIVELGAWKGRSTYALASACPGSVYSVDHWRGSQAERATAHMEAAQHDIITEYRRNTAGLANCFPVIADHNKAADFLPDVDMVFVDGGHTYDEVRANLIAWRGKAKRVLAGHDFGWHSVARAVRDHVRGEIYIGAGSIWLCCMDEAIASIIESA